jgi:hypothetical protein
VALTVRFASHAVAGTQETGSSTFLGAFNVSLRFRVHLRETGLMCRSIKLLRVPDHRATDEELSAASLQFIRKISGYRKPSKANQVAFDAAVAEVALAGRRLLDHLQNDPAMVRARTRTAGQPGELKAKPNSRS